MPIAAPNDSNPTLSADEIAKVHAIAAERRKIRQEKQRVKALEHQSFTRREAARRLLNELDPGEHDSPSAREVQAAVREGESKEMADLVAHNRAAEVTRVAAAKAAQVAAVAAETVRARALTSVAAKAAKLGVPFDLLAALKSRVSASAAHEAVLNAAADADEADAINTYVGPSATDISNYDRGSRDGGSMAVGWSKALERAASRAGL